MRNKIVFLLVALLFFVAGYFIKEISVSDNFSNEQSDSSHANLDIYIYERISDGSYLPLDSENPQSVESELGVYLKDYFNDQNNTNTANCNLDQNEYYINEVDLNDDNITEYIVYPVRICDTYIRGASGNGEIIVVQTAEKNFEVIGELRGNGYTISEQKTNNYRDLITNFHTSALTGSEIVYRFNTKESYNEYEEFLNKKYDLSKNTNP